MRLIGNRQHLSSPSHARLPGGQSMLAAAVFATLLMPSMGHDAFAADLTGMQVVQARCVTCHANGVNGAPKIGDRAAWAPRMSQGLDALVHAAIRGHGNMPPRGGLAELTDSEMRAAVIYMFNPGGDAVATRAEPASPPDPFRKTIAGTEILLGVVPAETIRAHAAAEPIEAAMHNGVPSAKGYFHLNISLHDSASNVEIKNAQVEARVATPLAGETRHLQPMWINGNTSYGGYFRLAQKGPYTITVVVHRPGAPQAIEARFDYRAY
jgi:cytochrome c5